MTALNTTARIAVIGAGAMGAGIAQVAAQAGHPVLLLDNRPGAAAQAIEGIDRQLGKRVENGKLSAQSRDATIARLHAVQDIDALADCALIIEAIVENLEVKRALFRQLEGICSPQCILASNTSSLSITGIAAQLEHPQRLLGLHFFNPVQLMKLVEVVRTDKTDAAVFEAARAFGVACGKTAIACKDTPGFVVNRLLVPYMSQALLMLERGDASAEDIDIAMKLGTGYPMGPIELTDYVGLDTTLSILEGWVKAHPNEPAFTIPKILASKVAEKKLGRKTGEGFYKWQGDKKA